MVTFFISNHYSSSTLKLTFLNEMEESFETYFEDTFFAHHTDNTQSESKSEYVRTSLTRFSRCHFFEFCFYRSS